MLTAEQIKAAKGKDIKTVEVPVPAWCVNGTPVEECKVLVRTFSGKAREKWDAARFKAYNEKAEVVPDGMALMATLACCDTEFKPIFTHRDIGWLSDMDAQTLQAIYEAALTLNGLNPAAEAETEKNLPSKTDSGSTSAETSESSPTT